MTIDPIYYAARSTGPTGPNDSPVRQLGPEVIQDFACPVCRAKQAAQPECRRCSADLSLYLKALRSVKESRTQLELASINGNSQLTEQTLNYLKWLSPG